MSKLTIVHTKIEVLQFMYYDILLLLLAKFSDVTW